MSNKIKLGDVEYDIDSLSDTAKTQLNALQFATQRLKELQDMQALLQKAKNAYIESIKMEMIADKAGFMLSDE